MAPNEALLNLSVSATLHVSFSVPVIMFVTARDDISTSTWGKVPAGGSCSSDATAPPLKAVVDFEHVVPLDVLKGLFCSETEGQATVFARGCLASF